MQGVPLGFDHPVERAEFRPRVHRNGLGADWHFREAAVHGPALSLA